jgi:hypothetical protein
VLVDAIVQAIPHWDFCEAKFNEGRKCTCGAVGRRSVLYVQITEHMNKVTKGRVYLT